MSHRIATSFAAAVIGMACIATDASARGGGGGGGGGGKGGGPVRGVTAIKPYGSPSLKVPSTIRRGVNVPAPAGGTAVGTAGVPGGAAAGARYYAPASYESTTACGRYPYPPCNKVLPTR
jgi:hypothetical protein